MTKQFEYEKQTFQEECVQNVTSIFRDLHQNQAFEKVGYFGGTVPPFSVKWCHFERSYNDTFF